MADRYVIDYGTSHTTSTEKYDTLAEAQIWEADVFARSGVAGTLLTYAAWLVLGSGAAFSLDAAKHTKQGALRRECRNRMALPFKSLGGVSVVDASGGNSTTSAAGRTAKNIFGAYLLGAVEVDALPDIAAVNAYDVVNDPPWPPAPALTSNQGSVQAAQNGAGLTTLLTQNVWTPINCLLDEVGLAGNFVVAGNQLTYSGEPTQEVLVLISISGTQGAGGGGDTRYRIGVSKDGAAPTRSMRAATENSSPQILGTWGQVIEVETGTVLTPAVVNLDNDKDFDLEDVVVTVTRWAT